MGQKQKGCGAERELVHMLWQNGWGASRIAGSGSNHYPSADIIAGKNGKSLIIECKSTKDKTKYITHEEIQQLQTFSKIFGAKSVIAVRYNNLGWKFYDPEQTEQTNQAKVFNKDKGETFTEFITKA